MAYFYFDFQNQEKKQRCQNLLRSLITQHNSPITQRTSRKHWTGSILRANPIAKISIDQDDRALEEQQREIEDIRYP